MKAGGDGVNTVAIESYRTLNMYLQRFFMHGIPNVKWIGKDKGFLEKLLDMEFTQQENQETCLMYRGKYYFDLSVSKNNQNYTYFKLKLFCVNKADHI